MPDRIIAQPERLEAYSEATRPTIAPVHDAAAIYSRAILAYSMAPVNDLGGACLVDHAPAVAHTADELAALDELPEAFARALRAIDDRMGPLVTLSAETDGRFDAAVDAALLDPDADTAELRAAAGEGEGDGGTPVWKLVWNSYDHPTSSYGSVVNLVNLGRWGRAANRLSAVEARAATSHLDLYWTGLNRAGRRAMARNLARSGRAQLPAARAAATAAEDALLTGRGPLSGVTSRVATRFPTVARWAPVAGRTLGWAGAGLQAVDTVDAVADGRYVDAGFSGAGAVGGVTLLFATGPVGIGVGSVLVVGSLAYEYREEIADGARWAGGKLVDGAQAVGGALSDGADLVGDGVGWLGEQGSKGLGSVARAFGIGG